MKSMIEHDIFFTFDVKLLYMYWAHQGNKTLTSINRKEHLYFHNIFLPQLQHVVGQIIESKENEKKMNLHV